MTDLLRLFRKQIVVNQSDPPITTVGGSYYSPVRASCRRGRGRARRRSRDARNGPARAREYGPALVLSGGSAFGLDATAGVQARLRGQDLTS
jgi:L-aminopeptidase/D-esterase-like protein